MLNVFKAIFCSWVYLKLAITMSLGVAQLINTTTAFRKYMFMQFLSLCYIHKANQEENFGFHFALMASSSDQEGNCSKWKRLQFLTLLTKHWPGFHPICGYSIHDRENACSSFWELNFWMRNIIIIIDQIYHNLFAGNVCYVCCEWCSFSLRHCLPITARGSQDISLDKASFPSPTHADTNIQKG